MELGHVMRRALICTAAMAALATLGGRAGEALAAPRQEQAAGRVEVNGKLRAPQVRAGGHDVPLRSALERIVPAEYSINLPNAGAWAETPVSWHAGRSFVEALREALSDLPDVSAKIDTGLQMVTVRSQGLPFGAAAPSAPRPTASDAGGQRPSAVPAAMAGAPQTEPPLIAPTQGQPPQALAAVQKSATAPPNAAGVQKIGNASPAGATDAARATAKTLSSSSAPGNAVSTPAAVPAQAVSEAQAAHPAAPSAPAPVAAADTFPVPAPEVSRTWRLDVADRTVKTALSRWAKEAGWQLVWEVPVDFGIDADATITGTFEDALHSVVRALDKSDTPIQAILYKGNKVLRVVAHGAAS